MLYQRTNIESYQVMKNVSTVSTVVSDSVFISRTSLVSFEVAWTTTSASGVFTVEASVTGNNWNTVAPLSSIPILSGASGSLLINVGMMGPLIVRLKYTPTVSASGTINAWAGGKSY